MALGVNQKSPAVLSMAENWYIIDALLGGTSAMRKARERFLPKWPNEDPEHYEARLAVATLFPAFERTVSVMSGKPFAKPLTYSDDMPKQIRQWCEDIDREGVNLDTFAAEMFRTAAVSYGFGGILVESPKALATGNRPPTVREQREAGMRPYFVRVRHDQILGWRTERINGARVLTQLRILETDTEPDGEFGEKEVQRVRVLTPGAWAIYEAPKGPATQSGAWRLVDNGTTSLPLIPFAPIYGLRKGFMIGNPPLLNLAYLNVKHWQSQSDQDTILHIARVPILFGKGFPDATTITIGSSHAVLAENSEHADLKFVEHNGASIDAGRQSLIDLEQQMIQTGAELLVKQPGQRTATETRGDQEANRCDLQRIASGFRDALNLALHYLALYSSEETGGTVSLFDDYGAASLSDASAQLILSMQQTGLIRKVTAVREQQRRGVLSGDIDPEQEVQDAAAEGPEPGDDEF